DICNTARSNVGVVGFRVPDVLRPRITRLPDRIMGHFQSKHGLKRVVNRIPSVCPLRDCARSRSRPQRAKREKLIPKIASWPCNESQPILRSNFVLILYLIKVNTAQANVTNLKLGIMERSNFRG